MEKIASFTIDHIKLQPGVYVSRKDRVGDQVITTGLGGVFPPDLLVGTVQDVVPEASGKSSIAVVRPGADPRTAKHVFIITAY